MANYLDPEEQLFQAYQALQSSDPYASRRMLTTAGGMAPGAGLMEAMGLYPSAEGGYEPSLGQNIRQGEIANSLLQLLGAGGDMAMATGALAPVGMMMKAAAQGGKALKAGSKAAKAVASEPNQVRGLLDMSYRSTHLAPGPHFGAQLHDLTAIYPSNVYSSNALRLYGSGYPEDKAMFELANRVRGNPNAEVTMYRAVPKNVKTINSGDWVTLSKNYAQNHGESVLQDDYKILSKKVKAQDLWTNADSIQEFGYFPQVD